MKRIHRSWIFPLILWGTLSGCVTGSVLTVPGELSRKASQAPPGAAGAPAVAVSDFSWSGDPSYEIGRDFDHVRSIVWKGNPGKAMADLIAGALAEKGIAAVRVAGEAEIPSGVPARVWGSVEEFRVNFKRVGTLKVEAEAGTTLKIHGAGPAAPARIPRSRSFPRSRSAPACSCAATAPAPRTPSSTTGAHRRGQRRRR